uniref:Uncharacterized protein n=1 Tax=Arundo donax TaxID=35708 RepID=A0A0A9AYM0_ARUDO
MMRACLENFATLSV